MNHLHVSLGNDCVTLCCVLFLACHAMRAPCCSKQSDPCPVSWAALHKNKLTVPHFHISWCLVHTPWLWLDLPHCKLTLGLSLATNTHWHRMPQNNHPTVPQSLMVMLASKDNHCINLANCLLVVAQCCFPAWIYSGWLRLLYCLAAIL